MKWCAAYDEVSSQRLIQICPVDNRYVLWIERTAPPVFAISGPGFEGEETGRRNQPPLVFGLPPALLPLDFGRRRRSAGH